MHCGIIAGVCPSGRALLLPHNSDQEGWWHEVSVYCCFSSPFLPAVQDQALSPAIRQGITTYEFVVAMRAMSEAPPASADEDGQNAQNILYSPTGSATTGFSGASSRGLQYKGAWCTPPRVFIDHQVGFRASLPFLHLQGAWHFGLLLMCSMIECDGLPASSGYSGSRQGGQEGPPQEL